MIQTVAAYALVAAAAFWLVRRWVRRRATGNCCGEAECPAAKQMISKLPR